MTDIAKRFLPLAALLAFGIIAWAITQITPPSNRQAKPPQPDIAVETLTVTSRAYQIEIQSFGTIRPRTQSQLTSQVSGQIIAISPGFRAGGFFEQGDNLVTIDPRDYDIAIETAEAELAGAEVALIEEEARAKQARTEWADARTGTNATDFALRKPQVVAARANLMSAKARLRQAKLNRERTQIKAPFSGRVLTKAVDVGQVVSENTNLAEVFATDFVEVPLPLKNSELSYIDLPETDRSHYQTRDQPQSQRHDTAPQVTIRSNLGDGSSSWQGRLVRTAGAVDANSNQLHVIAQIDDPYGTPIAAQLPLKIGQYVTATIEGRLLENAIVIPNAAIYQGSYVYVVAQRNGVAVLERRDISLAWQSSAEAIVAAGLTPGDQLVVTPLGQIISGTRVTAVDKALPEPPIQQTADAIEPGEPAQ